MKRPNKDDIIQASIGGPDFTMSTQEIHESLKSSTTGSGEPTTLGPKWCHKHSCYARTCAELGLDHTPSSSHPATVTLTQDQRDYIADTIRLVQKWIAPEAPESAVATAIMGRLRDALALLRAAETQERKP